MRLSRRMFLAAGASAAALRAAPIAVRQGSSRRVLTLVYDKSLGMMRAIDRVVP